MNQNKICTSKFSNPQTEREYRHKTAGKPGIRCQCESCHHYLEFNLDWGLCGFIESRIHLETIFEHFGCEKHSSLDSAARYRNPDPNVLLIKLEECERILTDIRPAYPTDWAKKVHLELRGFLKNCRNIRQELGGLP